MITNNLKTKSAFLVLVFACVLTRSSRAQLTISASDATICQGASTMLNAVVSGGTPPYTYNWGPSTGLSDPSIANPIANPAITTMYNVIVTDAVSNSNSATVTVTVNPAPTASAGPDQSGCFATNFTVSAATDPGATSYAWNWADGTYDFTQSATHSYTYAGAYSVTLTVSNSYGCTATDNLMITQYDDPQTTLNVHTTCPGYCNGSIGSVITAGNIPPLTYVWTNGEFTDSVSGLCAGSYALTVTNGMGCNYTTPSVTVATSIISISATPFQTICLGDSAHISAHVTGTYPAATFRWDNGSPFVTTDSSITVALTTGTSYTITVTDSNGCTANAGTGVSVNATSLYGHVSTTSGALSNGINTAVLYSYIPSYTAFDTVQTATVDASGNFYFTNPPHHDYLIEIYPDAVANPTLVPTYYGGQFLWDAATVLNHGCSMDDTVSIAMVETGSLSGPGSISGTIVKGAGFVRAPGEPIPGIDVKLGRNPGGQMIATTVTDGSGQYFFNNVPLNAIGEYYTIYVDIPGMLRDSTRNVVVDTAHSDYTNQDYVADSNSVFYVDATTGIALNKAKAAALSVYPNPSAASTTIRYTIAESAHITLDVYNVLGVRVAALANAEQPAGSYTCTFNAKNCNLGAGIYFVRLSTADKTTIQRLVISE